MHLVSFNIQYGKGRDGAYDLSRAAEAVRGADVICLQEVERHWARSGDVDQVGEIARLVGEDYFWVYGPTVDIHKGGVGASRNRRRQFGNMVLSRWPILWARRHLLPKQQLHGHFTIQRGIVEAVIGAPKPFRAYSTHLCHLSATTRRRQVETILAIHDSRYAEGPVATGPHPDPGFMEEPLFEATPEDAVIMGDMNFVPGAAEYFLFLGDESARLGPLVHQHRFVDVAHACGVDEPTFYRDFDTRSGVRIDHCFASASLAGRIERVRVDHDCIASDHQPLHVHLTNG